MATISDISARARFPAPGLSDLLGRSLFPAPALCAAIFVPALLVVAIMWLVTASSDVSAAFLTREPSVAVAFEGCDGAACGYAGAVSNLGVLVWAVGAVSAALAGLAVATGSLRAFLLAAAAVTGLLLVDDMFLLHDAIFDRMLPRGQQLVLAGEALLVAALVVRFRARLAAGPIGLLGLAIALIGLSTAIDVVAPGNHLIEDGIKFLGIVSWSAWLTLAAVSALGARASAT